VEPHHRRLAGTGESRHAEPSAPIDKKYSSPAADLHATTLRESEKIPCPRCLGKSENPLFTSRLVAVMQHYLEEFGWGVSILHNVSEKRRKA
jgi:hypothetical protein